jgi:hypothetical protein
MLVEETKRPAKLLRRVVARRARQLPSHQTSVAKDSGEVAGAGAMAIGIGAKKTGGESAKVGRKVALPSKHRSTSKVQ